MESKDIISKLETRYDALSKRFDNLNKDSNISRGSKNQLNTIKEMAKLAEQILDMKHRYGDDKDIYTKSKVEMSEWLAAVRTLIDKLNETLPSNIRNLTLFELEAQKRQGEELIRRFYIEHAGFS
jgi:ATP-dependent Lon protease